jgi:hypothetical protein
VRRDRRIRRARLAPVVERDRDRAAGPAATEGWNWSVDESPSSFTSGADLRPPSVDWVK